ncbi:hypothetical protein L596_024091 [Steinernema carpocapsae]|uniref:Tyrosine-protein kinase n=1 Tax=Steinernema carpocapsae TaxID=34508 RepID=A0A4V5ZZM1_STECR|nr:hypothetical protein L596_024091 [Steinernema carpocapsae]
MHHVGIQGIDKALLLESYYHGVVEKQDVEAALLKEGDFLVCMPQDESSRHVVSIAVLFNGKPRYFVIGKTKKNRFHVSAKSFDTIPLMIYHYSSSREALHPDFPIVLKRAIAHPEWLISHDRIRLNIQVGKGAFGKVYKATMVMGKAYEVVAVKTFRGQTADAKKRALFLQEARTMREYKHDHILRLIGIACQQEPLMIVLEYAGGGSLLKHLRVQGINLGIVERYRFCTEAASGLRYLEKLKCIHRDVAARNCLLTEAFVVKIADFGLSMKETELTIDPEKENLMMPIRWLAPEILKHRHFSTKSDVWAFGVLLFEIFTDGTVPYKDMTLKEVRARLTDSSKFRLEIPIEFPPGIRKIIDECWDEDAAKRPSFKALHKTLHNVKF